MRIALRLGKVWKDPSDVRNEPSKIYCVEVVAAEVPAEITKDKLKQVSNKYVKFVETNGGIAPVKEFSLISRYASDIEEAIFERSP